MGTYHKCHCAKGENGEVIHECLPCKYRKIEKQQVKQEIVIVASRRKLRRLREFCDETGIKVLLDKPATSSSGSTAASAPGNSSGVKIEALRRAWHVKGPAPSHHEEAQRRLVKSWPALHRAIMGAIS